MKDWLKSQEIEFQENIPFKEINRLNNTGICTLFCKPNSIEKLKGLISYSISKNIRFDVIGNTTNTYLSGTFCPQVLISTLKVNEFIVESDTITCGSGFNLTKLARWCVEHGIAGYEGFIGIPGTVGAAAINNSGAFSSEMSKVVKSVTVITIDNLLYKLTNDQMEYSTRSSVLKSKVISAIVLSIELDIAQKEKKDILGNKVCKNIEYRKKIVDGTRKSLGSIFVSTSLHELRKQNKIRFILKKICFIPFRIFMKDSRKINVFLEFLFLGIPKLAKHCDSLNRFCWDKTTSEQDFYHYINSLQQLANNKLKLEIDIKK